LIVKLGISVVIAANKNASDFLEGKEEPSFTSTAAQSLAVKHTHILY
jgi:hypothetical protein